MDDIESISAITYGIQIPEEYMSDVLKSLSSQYIYKLCPKISNKITEIL